MKVKCFGGLVSILISVSFVSCNRFTDLCYKNYRENNFDKAIDECSKQINGEIRIEHKERAYNNRGLAYEEKGQLDQAIADFNKAIELNPKDEAAYNNRGGVSVLKGHLDQAIADFNKAIELNPKDEAAYNNRGLFYQGKGQTDQAIADYGKAIELNARYEEAFNNRAAAYVLKGQVDQAIADFSKASELNPKNAGVYFNRGTVNVLKGQLDQGIADFNKAIELNPRIEKAYSNRGTTYLLKGHLDQAIADFNKAIELNPEYERAYTNRGLVYQANGQFDMAIADFNKAIELNPKYEKAYLYLLITTWISKANDKEAADRLRHYISSNNSNEWIRTISKFYLGIDRLSEESVLTEARKGQDEKEIKERHCEAYFYLGVKRLANGNRTGAVKYFTNSIESGVNNFSEYEESEAILTLMRNGRI